MRLNDIGACAPSAVSREAARLLQMLIAGADMAPQPDGTTRFIFECTDTFVDRLSLWAAAAVAAEASSSDQVEAAPTPVVEEEVALAVTEGAGNVIAPEGLARNHAIRTSAREALALLHAANAGASLPELTLRPLAERLAFGGEGLGDDLASREVAGSTF